MTIKDWIQTYARELEGSDAERELMKAVDQLLEDFADGIAAEEAWIDAKNDIKALMAEGYKAGYIAKGIEEMNK